MGVIMAKRGQSAAVSLFVVIFAILFFIVSYTFSQVFGNALADVVVKWIGHMLGASNETVSAIIAFYVIPAGVAGMSLWAAYRTAYWFLENTVFADDPHAFALTLPLMGITEIAEYLRDESVWGWRTYVQLNFKDFVHDIAPAEMRRAGMAGDVRFIGTHPNTAKAVEIDATYWQYAKIDSTRIWDSRNQFFTDVSAQTVSVPGLQNFQFGKAPRIDVMRTWPRASRLRKVWSISYVAAKKIRYWMKAKVSCQ